MCGQSLYLTDSNENSLISAKDGANRWITKLSLKSSWPALDARNLRQKKIPWW